MKITKFKIKKLGLRLLINILVIYLFFMVVGLLFADTLIFPTPKSSYSENLDGLIKITSRDGITIHALHKPRKDSNFVFLYCHGNAEDLGNIEPIADIFNLAGYSFLTFDYRGYGLNNGRPAESNVYKDALTVYDHMTNELGYKPEQIIAFGRSIGAAVALELTSRRQVAAVVLESGFTSAFRVITKVPIYPFDKYNNLRKIKNLHKPVLIVHGQKDKIVPAWHGRKLYKAANEPKLHHWIKYAGHNDIFMHIDNTFWNKIDQLLNLTNK